VGEVLPQQAIRIFLGASLPGTLRVTKIDLHLQELVSIALQLC